ncbi:MAG TPA: hypothetical protein VFV89_04080 [Nocardioides sp.]|uniref:hypothetical protein n=1 Tax=Nocardioides sp. TaxID=35761 RepID=UPI002E35E246|nr:hypothetical protein [Nocardioides sp.]HEX5086962.1 hypothetical protein [Nocardioides sp.]
MRLARIVAALVALILTASAGQALISPADAMGKPKHQITGLGGGEIRNTNHFYIKGKVATYPKHKIKVLRNVSGGPYKVFKKVKTKSSGKFRTSIAEVGRKKTCFKIQVPATATYKKTTSPVIGCITSS